MSSPPTPNCQVGIHAEYHSSNVLPERSVARVLQRAQPAIRQGYAAANAAITVAGRGMGATAPKPMVDNAAAILA